MIWQSAEFTLFSDDKGSTSKARSMESSASIRMKQAKPPQNAISIIRRGLCRSSCLAKIPRNHQLQKMKSMMRSELQLTVEKQLFVRTCMPPTYWITRTLRLALQHLKNNYARQYGKAVLLYKHEIWSCFKLKSSMSRFVWSSVQTLLIHPRRRHFLDATIAK